MWEPTGIRVNYTSLTERIRQEFQTRFEYSNLFCLLPFRERKDDLESFVYYCLWDDELKTIVLEERPIHPVVAIQEYEGIITSIIDDSFEIIQKLGMEECELDYITGVF